MGLGLGLGADTGSVSREDFGWGEALMENSWGPASQAYQTPITPIALSLRPVLPPSAP